VTDIPLTITEAAEGLRAKRYSSVELTSAFLKRAEEIHQPAWVIGTAKKGKGIELG